MFVFWFVHFILEIRSGGAGGGVIYEPLLVAVYFGTVRVNNTQILNLKRVSIEFAKLSLSLKYKKHNG